MQRSQSALVLLSLLSGLALGCNDAEEAQGSVSVRFKTHDVSSVEAELIEDEDSSTLRLLAFTENEHMGSFIRVDVHFGVLLPGTYEFFGDVELSPQEELFALGVPMPCQNVEGKEWPDTLILQRVCLVYMPHGVTGLDMPMTQRVSGRIVIKDLRGGEVRGEISVWALGLPDFESLEPQELVDWPIYSGGVRASLPFVAKHTLGM